MSIDIDLVRHVMLCYRIQNIFVRLTCSTSFIRTTTTWAKQHCNNGTPRGGRRRGRSQHQEDIIWGLYVIPLAASWAPHLLRLSANAIAGSSNTLRFNEPTTGNYIYTTNTATVYIYVHMLRHFL